MFAFRNLPNLKVLIVTNNPGLLELEAHSFGSLRGLNYLSLGANKLGALDGFIFSASSSIKIIDLIGNPIRRIRSHAFHGLRNVTDLFLSLEHKRTPIESIEGDSFISTAFVDHIYLDGIQARRVATHAFRGLSFCQHLHMSHALVEEVDANAFYRANNIQRLVMRNSRLRRLHRHAFRGMFNVDVVDLRGNYLARIDQATFEEHLLPAAAEPRPPLYRNDSSSIVLIDDDDRSRRPPTPSRAKRLLFEQNPIQCDCSLMWILGSKFYAAAVGLPEICAGPKGYDCLRIVEVTKDKLVCPAAMNETTKEDFKLPCDDLVFDVNDKNSEIFSVAAPKGRKKSTGPETDDDNDDEKDDEEQDTTGDDYGNSSSGYMYEANSEYYNSDDHGPYTSYLPNGERHTSTISSNLFDNVNENNRQFLTAARSSSTSRNSAQGGSAEVDSDKAKSQSSGGGAGRSSSISNLVKNRGVSVFSFCSLFDYLFDLLTCFSSSSSLCGSCCSFLSLASNCFLFAAIVSATTQCLIL